MTPLEKIAAHIPGVVYQYQLWPDGRSCFPYASDGIREIYGVTPEQVREDASAVFEVLHPDDFDQIVESIRYSAETLDVWHLRYRVNLPGGNTIWVEGESTPERQDDGSVLWHGYIRDITDRVVSEHRFSEQENRRNALLEVSLDGICIINEGHRIIEANQSFCNMLGYDQDEILELRTWDYEANLSKQQIIDSFSDLSEIQTQFESRHRRKDGSIIDVEISARGMVTEGLPLVMTIVRDISQRKQVERELHDSVFKYKSLLNNLPQLVWQKDSDGVYQSCNFAYAKSFGLDPENLTGKTDYDLYPKELAEKYRGDDQRIIEVGQIEVFDEHWLDGSEQRLVHTTKVPLKNTGGKVYATLGIAEDITDHKRTEAALRRQQELINAIFLQAGDAIEMSELETFRIIEFNDAAHTLLGYSREEYAQLTIFDIQGELAENEIRDIISNLPRGETHQFENKHRCKDGTILDTELSIRFMQFDEVEYVVAVWRDISAQKRINEELKNYRENLEQRVNERTAELNRLNQQLLETQFAMNKAGIGIHWVNANTGEILYVNEYAADMLGYSVEEMLQKKVQDLDPNFPAGEFVENTRKMFSGGSAHFETVQRASDGKLIPVQLDGYLLPESEEATSRFITFNVDITNRKMTENELINAKEYAELANRSKSEFLSNMSHELRTPMHAILSFSNLGLKKVQDKKIDHYLQNIRTSGIRLTSLLDDLLDLSKLESGKMQVNFVEQDLITLVGLAITEVQSLTKDKSMTIDVDSDRVIDCMIDQKLMMQVVVNLLSNAIKFSSYNSKINIEVKTIQYTMEDDGEINDVISLSVIDEGVGIPPDEVETIFDKFVQSTKTRSQAGGTGLGLPITKEIIELHNGSIRAESPPAGREQGSAFILEIPRYHYDQNLFKHTDFSDALNQHVKWKQKLTQITQNQVVPDDMTASLIANDSLCSFGIWLNTYASDDHKFDELKQLHQEFHHLASECIAFCQVGDFFEATRLLASLEAVSDNLFKHADHISKH